MAKSSLRVLVIDDEPDIRELLELTLIKMGLDVATAASVGAAPNRGLINLISL